jgi:hypothetical protein
MIWAVLASVLLGAVSTLGDFVWASLSLRHRVAFGLVHGAVICLCIGGVIGWRSRRLAPAAAAGPVVGVLAAAVFYLLVPQLGWAAMVPAWMFFWICFALLQARLHPAGPYRGAIVRGLAAALLSGAAFWAISGIWTEPSPGGPDYVRNFLSWTVAFLPGFVALFAGERGAAEGAARANPG